MGTYYKIVNLDKKETIDLYQYANIKAGAYEHWSFQVAILTLFLGGSTRHTNIAPRDWFNRWAGDRIRIENDAQDYEPDTDDWIDAGHEFVKFLDLHNLLEVWFTAQRFNADIDYVKQYLQSEKINS